MDSKRFDGFVRSFGRSRSRRQTLLGLAGFLAAGALALGEREADAGKRSGGSPCTKARQCKTGKCIGTSGAKTCSCSNRFPRCVSSDTYCQSGTCQACLALQADCTNAEQCCQGEEKMACGPIGNLGQDQCCRPFGGACSNVGSWEECCTVFLEGGGARLVDCAPTNTCGGWGASCNAASMCASGVCCRGSSGLEGVCCNAGQFCVNNQCVG
jgi:hypothetical protein